MGYYGVSINTQISTAYSQSNIEARSLVDDGHLHALVGDFSQLPTYWEGMSQDLPNHPVCMDSRRWKNSLGCTFYCSLAWFIQVFFVDQY
jgi:hypothetical protein